MTVMTDENYCLYLRKSRADNEAELHGEGETLARHEKLLLELAKKQKLNITHIYKEVVSGESIEARPQMKQLLYDVMQGKYAGVLCVEVERLARGDTMDQGEVAKTFKFGNCKIITPTKTYDPNNEFDEEYFEFGLFMSRREYKTINRRIQRGRIASVEEGKWISSTAPYGYNRVKIQNDKGWTLQINTEEAEIVQLIFELYTKGMVQKDGSYKRYGQHLIAKHLDSSGIKPRNSIHWSSTTIKDILTNPVYIGKVRWGWRPDVKVFEDGQIVTKRTKMPPGQYRLIDGLHDAIIDEFTFNKAQKIRAQKAIYPIVSNKELKNPLSGMAYCGMCGQMMTRASSNTKLRYPVLRCPNPYCNNISAPLFLVEEEVIKSLRSFIENYKIHYEEEPKTYDTDADVISIDAIKKDIARIDKQIDNTYDLLEQGLYDSDTFLSRNKKLSNEKEELKNNLVILENHLNKKKHSNYMMDTFIPEFEHALDSYDELESFTARNEVLHKILDRFYYTKEKPNKKGELMNASFQLDIHPKLPDSEG